MTTPRVPVSAEQLTSGQIELAGEKAHYLCQVLRLKPGARFFVFTKEGQEAEAEITRVGYRRVVAKVLGPAASSDADPRHPVCVVLAVLKGSAMDWAVQKLAEVGAWTIIPMISQRVVVRAEDWQAKVERWQEIASEAARRSGRCRGPEVVPVVPISKIGAVIADASKDRWLLLDPDAQDAASVPEALSGASSAGLIIGPEGDLTDEEKKVLVETGARPVYLGPRVLRAETAAVVACALALYALGDLGPPRISSRASSQK
jgi:16S rRNA (uracil1498-N3)-methyltransferase